MSVNFGRSSEKLFPGGLILKYRPLNQESIPNIQFLFFFRGNIKIFKEIIKTHSFDDFLDLLVNIVYKHCIKIRLKAF